MSKAKSEHVLDSDVVRQHVAEKEALVKVLELYADCRHGSVGCFCTVEARAAVYPYLRRRLQIAPRK